MTRAAFLSAGGDVFLSSFVFKLFKERFYDEIDRLWICFNNHAATPPDVVAEFLGVVSRDPKVRIIYHPVGCGNGRPITEMTLLSKEDYVMLLEDDGFIFNSGIVNKCFQKIESDLCFIAGTKIQTLEGEKNIEDIRKGDLVLTRQGFKKVLKSLVTGEREVITRLGITGTPEHPFITTKGIKAFKDLTISDTIYSWNQSLSCIEKRSIEDIQSLNIDNTEFITQKESTKNLSLSIDKFGSTILEKYLLDMWFIIKTIILSIMNPPIYNCYPIQNTCLTMPLPQKELLNQNETLNSLEKKQKYGTLVNLGGNGIVKWLKEDGKIKKLSKRLAKYVQNFLKLFTRKGQRIVQGNVKTNHAIVYNLTIKDAHEYFANNILVHNCDVVGSPRFSCGDEIGEASKKKYNLDYSGYGDVGPNMWPNFFFCKRKDLLRTDLNFGSKSFVPGEYSKELDHTFRTVNHGDTFVWGCIQLRALGLRFHQIPQHHADVYEIESKNKSEMNWHLSQQPFDWIHGGSLSAGYGGYLSGSAIPATDDSSIQEMESRVAFWELCSDYTDGFTEFKKQYKQGIVNLINNAKLEYNRIAQKKTIYKTLMRL